MQPREAPIRPSAVDRQGGSGGSGSPRYTLCLYVIGASPNSARALANVRSLCESHLPGRHELEVIDISVDRIRAIEGQVIAAPTLVREQPLPVRRFIGDMSATDRLLAGLDLATTG